MFESLKEKLSNLKKKITGEIEETAKVEKTQKPISAEKSTDISKVQPSKPEPQVKQPIKEEPKIAPKPPLKEEIASQVKQPAKEEPKIAPKPPLKEETVSQVKQPVKEEPKITSKPEPKQEEKKSWFSFGFSKKEEVKEEKKEVEKGGKEVKSAVFTDSIFSKTIKEDKVEEFLWDLEVALLESDVALPVIDEIKDNLKKELVGKKVKLMQDVGEVVEDSLRNAITNALSIKPIDFDRFIETHEKPVVLMFVGVNGSGKTTTIARIAHRLKKKGYSCVIAAGDTFRAGAIEQLERHAEKLGVKLIKQKAGSDPAAVAYDSIEHAKAHRKDVVLIDTAGRMQTNVNLMKEMEKIKRVSKPDLVIFVGDSLAGNDAIEQARKFNEAVNIDAAVLTKIDADAKGGAALSIAHAVGKPIIFVGVGQGYDDLIPFDAKWMVDRLFESKGKDEAAT